MEPNSTAGWGYSDPDPSPRELLEHAEETIRLLREKGMRAEARVRGLREALREANHLLADSRPDYVDPSLRRQWGRRRQALRNMDGGSS